MKVSCGHQQVISQSCQSIDGRRRERYHRHYKKKRQTATITYIDDYHLVVATCYYDCIRDTKERYTLQKGCLRCVCWYALVF